MLTGLLSTLFCAYSLLAVGHIPDPEPSPSGIFTKEARLTAIVLDQRESIDVSIEYLINKSNESSQISYIGLEAFDTQIESIYATFNSKQVTLFPDSDRLKIEGKIDLPESLAKDTSFSFTLSYKLRNARHLGNNHFDINIPLIWIENSRPASNKSFFEAHLVIPEEYYINESFPANARSCGKEEAPGHSCFYLQVLPTFLRVRGMVGHDPIFTPVKVLDYSILLLLAAICLFIGIQLTKKRLVPVYNA